MMMMVIGGDKDNNDDDGDDKARYLLPPRAARGWWQITEEYGHHRNFRLLTVVSPLCCSKLPLFPIICYALFWQPSLYLQHSYFWHWLAGVVEMGSSFLVLMMAMIILCLLFVCLFFLNNLLHSSSGNQADVAPSLHLPRICIFVCAIFYLLCICICVFVYLCIYVFVLYLYLYLYFLYLYLYLCQPIRVNMQCSPTSS